MLRKDFSSFQRESSSGQKLIIATSSAHFDASKTACLQDRYIFSHLLPIFKWRSRRRHKKQASSVRKLECVNLLSVLVLNFFHSLLPGKVTKFGPSVFGNANQLIIQKAIIKMLWERVKIACTFIPLYQIRIEKVQTVWLRGKYTQSIESQSLRLLVAPPAMVMSNIS
jgi:hypothetical protein